MSRESNPALAESRDCFVTFCNRVALDSYISPFKLLVLFYFYHPVSISDVFFYEYRRFHFIPFPYSIFSPFLEPSIFFSKSPHWRKSYTGRYKVQDFTSPRGNLTASLPLPLSLVHCTAMSIFPFHIYISSATSLYVVTTVTFVTFLNLLCDVSRELIPGKQRFNFFIMGLQYRLHHSEVHCSLILLRISFYL